MLGINGGEFLLLILVALVVVGPERLPRYAEQLGAWVRTARGYALDAKKRVSEELGEDVADVDWAALDPRRYDPRRIVREALLDDSPPAPTGPARPRPGSGATSAGRAGATAGAAGAVGAGAGAAPDGGVVPASHGGNGQASGATPSDATAPVPTPFDDEAT